MREGAKNGREKVDIFNNVLNGCDIHFFRNDKISQITCPAFDQERFFYRFTEHFKGKCKLINQHNKTQQQQQQRKTCTNMQKCRRGKRISMDTSRARERVVKVLRYRVVEVVV